jgi:hypothetical protein
MFRPHPETDGMTMAEILTAIAEAEEKLRLANEIPDEQAAAWFSQELPADFKIIRKRRNKWLIRTPCLRCKAKVFHQQVGDFILSRRKKREAAGR